MVEAAQILIYDVTNQIFGNHSDTDILASTPRVRTGSCLMIAFGTVYTLGRYSFGELRGAMQKSRDS
jgi:hypothetical protein